MGQTPHYFIAIPITDELKNEFAKWQAELKEKLSYKIWPHQDDLHITLKFLGAVEETELKELRESLRSISMNSFSIQAGTIGTFGKHDSPRVLWAGVEKSNSITELYKKIEHEAIELGFPKENRPYAPHITLAKKWNGTSEQIVSLQEIKERYWHRSFQMTVEEFVLYQIFPNQSPKYKRVDTYRCKRG